MLQLLLLGLLVVYGVGAWKFWNGFGRTNFTANRLLLTLGWPVFLVNASYRRNFTRALKG
ncbi:MAG TPA: hypothetical protein IGS37_00320 [Synechococcales cyanobacterium M55_K2018_004]|nr:hypothetical protein [Synechococcales cyanobacterium M55_K2018_004]